MSDEQETLQELFRRRQRELGGLTVRQVWLRCDEAVSYHTFRAVEAGTRSRGVNEDTINALAVALDVPVSHVLRAAGERPRLTRFVAPRRWDQLTIEERKALSAVADAILNASRGTREQPPVDLHAVEDSQSSPERVKRAARRRPADDQ